MITPTNPNYVYYGLSTDDPKPTENITNGSIFFEMDSGKKYVYDEQNSLWVEQ